MTEGFNAQGAANYATYASNLCINAAKRADEASDTLEGHIAAEADRAISEKERNENEQGRKEAETARGKDEALRLANEEVRKKEEAKRIANEKERVSAEEGRNVAEAERERIVQGIREEAESGAFDGEAAGFGAITASVDGTSGKPSVTVDSSGTNAAKDIAFNFKGLKGPPGNDGKDGYAFVTSLNPGFFHLAVGTDGHLYVTHNDNDPAPPLTIRDGHLIYTITP